MIPYKSDPRQGANSLAPLWQHFLINNMALKLIVSQFLEVFQGINQVNLDRLIRLITTS